MQVGYGDTITYAELAAARGDAPPPSAPLGERSLVIRS